jgi:hypothetical protein
MPKPSWSDLKVSLKLGVFSAEGTWKPNKEERAAAWEMYVELITRISVAELRPEEGLLRETLSSLHSLFGTTREILRKHGPAVAGQSYKDGEGELILGEKGLSFGYLAVFILNVVLRPALAKWHPSLLDYENTRAVGVSPSDHERHWAQSEEMRRQLNDVRAFLVSFSQYLAQAAGVPSLIIEREEG